MSKQLLPKPISLSKAASLLKFDTLTHVEAINFLLEFAIHDQLPIFMNCNIKGYRKGLPIQQDFDPEGFPCNEIIEERNEVAPVSYTNGSIRFISGYYDGDKEEGPLDISVLSFQQNGTEYYSTDSSHIQLYPSSQNEDCFYIIREDLLEFINTMGEKKLTSLSADYKDVSNKPSNNDNFSAFHSLEGLLYEDITITFLEGDAIELKAKTVVRSFTYEVLSLRERRKKGLFAINDAGKFLISYLDSSTQHKSEVPSNVTNKGKLKKLINKWFGLKGDPFDKIGDKFNIYKAKFKIKNESNRGNIRAEKKAKRITTSYDALAYSQRESEIEIESGMGAGPDSYSASEYGYDEGEDDAAGDFLKGEE